MSPQAIYIPSKEGNNRHSITRNHTKSHETRLCPTATPPSKRAKRLALELRGKESQRRNGPSNMVSVPQPSTPSSTGKRSAFEANHTGQLCCSGSKMAKQKTSRPGPRKKPEHEDHRSRDPTPGCQRRCLRVPRRTGVRSSSPRTSAEAVRQPRV